MKPKPQRADNGQVEDLVRKLGDARMDTSAPDEDAAKAASAFAGGYAVATATVTDSTGIANARCPEEGQRLLREEFGRAGVFKVGSDLGEALEQES